MTIRRFGGGGTSGGGGATSYDDLTGLVPDADIPASIARDSEVTSAISAASTTDRDRANHTGTQVSTTISDFTEAVQDAVATLLGAGSNITLNYDDAGNTLTVTGSGAGGLDAEAVRDAIGVALVGVGNIGVTVNDAADTITISTTATVNSTDAALRDRSTHSGSQAISTVTSLQAALDGKATTSHTHGVTDLTATGTKDDTTYLRGDNTWATPAGGGGGGGAVSSVNTETGAVVLDAADVGATRLSVDGTYAATYDIDTTTVTPGDIGAATDSAVIHNTGAETVAGVKTFSSAPVVPDGSFAEAKVTGLVADLAAKGAASDVAKLLAAAGYTGTLRGAWAGSTAYSVGDVVTVENGVYRIITAHTSNAAGFRYDREKWETLPIPVLEAGTRVPVRELDLTSPGAGSSNPPTAGLFQQRPKQFNYSAEKVLWAFQSTSNVSVTGSGASAADGTAPGGSVVLTTGSSAEAFLRHTTVLSTAVDVTGTHLRIPIKISSNTSHWITVFLSSAGTDFTNYHAATVMAGNTDGTRTGQWTTISVPISEFTATGTGATLTAINGMRLSAEPTSGGAFTAEFSRVSMLANTSAKAKVILWLDDGSWTNHLTAITTAAKYGFPVTLAPIADNLVNSTAAITADAARYIQDVLGGQIAVHAFGPQDHNNAQTGATAFDQLLHYQHFGLAMGFHGVEDMAYWSSGLTGPNTAADTLNIRKLFRSARGGTSRLPETLPPGDPTLTRAMMTGAGNTSTGTFQPYVTRAVSCKGVAQFVWHNMDSTTLTEFATFCAWLDTQRANVDVVTPQGAFDPFCRPAVTKGDIGLGAVDNTADTAKPVSTAQATAIASVTANTQTASYTLVLADAGRAVEMNVASGNTLTVPPNSAVAFPIGTVVEVAQYGAGQVTLTPGAGVTLLTASSLTTRARYSVVSLRKRGTDEWVAAGDLT